MRIFPLSEVRRGLEGVAYTVFEGVTPEPMRVEILGVLHDSLGPGQDMILARLHGPKPEFTGVVAGMSGSPVYIDGRLLGALSYRIGQFSKEPIAGITPIEQMLEVRDGQGVPAAPSGNQRVRSSVETGSLEIQAMETPLVFSGFSPDTIERFGDRFRSLQGGRFRPEPAVQKSVRRTVRPCRRTTVRGAGRGFLFLQAPRDR